MQLVLTESEVAAALRYSREDFIAMRQRLESFGFPKSIAGLEERWSIIEIANWINRQEDDLPGMAEERTAKVAHLRVV